MLAGSWANQSREHPLFTDLAFVARHCLDVLGQQSATLTGLFLAGLAGSLTHCTGMCGPFVLSQTGSRLAARGLEGGGFLHRLDASVLLPYHLGRLTTYALLGAVLSVPVGYVVTSVNLWWLPPILLVVAAVLFVAIGLHLLRADQMSLGPYQKFGAMLARLGGPLALKPYGLSGYTLGLLLGFLPCGLVYAALIAATSLGGPLSAAFAMFAFGLGTVPALIFVAFGGSWLLPRLSIDIRRFAPYVALGNAAFLTLLALDMALKA